MKRRRGIGSSWIYTTISIVSVATVVAAYFVTRDNYKLMREDMEIRNRPILSLEDWNVELGPGTGVRDGGKFVWETKNYGQTPATNISLELGFYNINNLLLYSRMIYKNKYLVPSQLISHETENIDYRFSAPSSIGLYERYKNRTLRMKITLRYGSIRERARQYVYEISGIIRDDGWKTSSESWDEIMRKPGKTIYIEVPEGPWGEDASGKALNSSLLSPYKLHGKLSRLVEGIFSGKKFNIFGWEFAIMVRNREPEQKEKPRFSYIAPGEVSDKRE